MKKKILDAIRRFNNGDLPDNCGKPRCSYFLNKEDNRLYPTKIIWALANNVPAVSFKTKYAEDKLDDLGFKPVRTDNESEFYESVKSSLQDSVEAREKRLLVANKKAIAYKTETVQFKRNPDVVAAVLYRANGICEKCKNSAPFLRKKDDTPYLEVHHIIPLAEDGDDTVENCIALCPNCHRKEHFG